jgi:diguanylate cyclase
VADALAFPTPKEALRAADQALLRAKDQGRNRIVAAGSA